MDINNANNRVFGKSAKLYIEDGIRLYNKQHYQMALKDFEQAIRCSPTSARALHGKGIVLVQMKEYRKALESFEQASKLAPNVAKIYADLAEAAYLLEDYEKSGLGYRRAIELDGMYESAYSDKVKLLIDKAIRLRKPETRDVAITAFRQVLLFDPANATANYEISRLQKVKNALAKRNSSTENMHYSDCTCPLCVDYT